MTDQGLNPSTLENALRGLAAVIKAVRFYPPAHPALQAALDNAVSQFAALLSGQERLALSVRKDRFLREGMPVAATNPAVKKLAHHLFARRVQDLSILPDLSAHDLEQWSRCLAREPEEIIRAGGLAKVLAGAEIATIWVNETDLSKILAAREEVLQNREELDLAPDGNGDPPPPETSPGEISPLAELELDLPQPPPTPEQPRRKSIKELLAELSDNPTENEFHRLLRELQTAAREIDHVTGFATLIAVLGFLGRCTRRDELSTSRREACGKSFEELLASDVADRLVHLLCTEESGSEAFRRVRSLLLLLRERGAHLLANRLADENDAQIRKRLAQTLVQFEGAAIPALMRLLKDPRWYVVRNAAAILGELRDPEKTAHLAVLLIHDDQRVRREAIRALTRIGTPEAMEVLLVAVEEGDSELQRQALVFLGAMKQRAAIAHLLRFVALSDLLMERNELRRGAIRALGEMGATEAVPALTRLLNQTRLFRRRRFVELQTTAIQALARIGSAEARSALENVAEKKAGTLGQAARHALRDLFKNVAPDER